MQPFPARDNCRSRKTKCAVCGVNWHAFNSSETYSKKPWASWRVPRANLSLHSAAGWSFPYSAVMPGAGRLTQWLLQLAQATAESAQPTESTVVKANSDGALPESANLWQSQ